MQGKIIRKDGYVYYVEGYDRPGFETYNYLGKDIDDPMWAEEVKGMKRKKRTKKEGEK